MNEVRSSTKFYLHVLSESIPVLKENGLSICSEVSEHELRRRPIEQITNTALLVCKLHRRNSVISVLIFFLRVIGLSLSSPSLSTLLLAFSLRLSTLVFRFCVMSEVRTPAIKCLDYYLTLIIFTSSAFVIILELSHHICRIN